MIFKLRKDIVRDEQGKSTVRYGIDAYDVVLSVADIFSSKEKAQGLVDKCNMHQPSREHFRDVVIDAVQEEAALIG